MNGTTNSQKYVGYDIKVDYATFQRSVGINTPFDPNFSLRIRGGMFCDNYEGFSYKGTRTVMQEGEFHGAVGIRAPPGINGFALYVGGDVWAKTYRAANPPWADFVFDEQYDLPTLEEVEQHIRQHKHLPDIPSEAEIKKEKGIDLAVINAKLLQKIEELTLYLIDQNKRLQAVEQTNRELQQKIQTLTTHD